MAYLNFLLSVPEEQVDALRKDASILLTPTKLTGVSHLLGYWVKVKPLEKLLGEVLDGGEIVNAVLWHPLRAPMFHRPEAVKDLYIRLVEAWKDVLSTPATAEGDFDWYKSEMSRLLTLLEHAANRNECVVSVLEPPADPERANRTRIPFKRGADSPQPEGPHARQQHLSESSSGIDGRLLVWLSLPIAVVFGAVGLCWWRFQRARRRCRSKSASANSMTISQATKRNNDAP